MTQFVPLRRATKCDNTVKLLRVNKDQYTKQRGHRKIFTVPAPAAFRFLSPCPPPSPLLARFFFSLSFMNLPWRGKISRRSNIPETRNRARAHIVTLYRFLFFWGSLFCFFRSINGAPRRGISVITLHQRVLISPISVTAECISWLPRGRMQNSVVLRDASRTYFP